MALGHGENKYEKYGKPTLDLQFSGPKGSISNRADGGAISVEFTRTQDTQASYVKSDGIIGYASTDVPRFDHDPVTGESLGLLIEQSRTNLALESEDWGNTTYWHSNGNKGGLNQANTTDYFIATNNTTDTLSPDGANNAVKLAGDTSFTTSGYSKGRVHIVTQSITLSQNTQYTFSFFIKDPNSVLDSNQILYIMYGSMFSNTNAYAAFDLQNNTVSYGGDYTSSTPGSIKSYPNGWKKLTATFTNTASGGGLRLFIAETDNFYGPNTFSTNGESFYAFGFQIEQGTFGTSYIPTSGSTSARGVDTASITGTNFSSWYNSSSEGSMFIDIKRPTVASSGAYLSFHNRSGYFLQDVSTNFILRIAGENSVTLGAYATTTDYKIASSYLSATEFNTSVNGSTPVSTSTSINFTNATELHIGRGDNSITAHYRNGPSNCHIRRLTFWPTRLSDSDLQSLTE